MSEQNSSERIRDLAYRLWEERGRGPGGALDDWLAAEREINANGSAGTELPVSTEPPIKVPNPPEVEAPIVEDELAKIASRDAPGG